MILTCVRALIVLTVVGMVDRWSSLFGQTPVEQTDLSADPKYSVVKQRLFREWQTLQIQMGDDVSVSIE